MALRSHVDRHYNLRDNAYPFDWVISPFEAIYKCLEEDFAHFLQVDSLKLYDHSDGVSGVLDIYYGFQFIHDFPTHFTEHINISELEANPAYMGLVTSNFLDHVKPIQEKYARRIERFRNALSSNNEIIFIRTTITKEQAISLHNLIKNKYPNLIFTLIAIDSSDEIKSPWNIPGIKNFYISNTFESGSYEWLNIFKTIGLL